MSDGRRVVLLLVLGLATLVCAPAAPARNLKIWPFFEYQSDTTAGMRSVKLLGPLIEYRSDPDHLHLALRPLLSIRQSRVGHDDEVRILYPLITSRWGDEEQTTIGAGGLLRYRTATTADGKTLTRQQFRALPVYFYDWEAQSGTALSLVPLYADVEDVFGFERVQMVAFPAYLRLRQAELDRRYVLFPFFGTVDGPPGSGDTFWPFYGRMTSGSGYESGFVLWPFYIWDSRTADGETEERLLSFPFYARVRGPARESTAYGMIAYVHARDRAAARESWGFPWPLWIYEKSTATDELTTLRFFPFYQRRRQAELDERLFDWPYWREHPASGYARSVAIPVLSRDEERVDVAAGKRSHVHTLFPFYRNERSDESTEGDTPALLDAVAPYDVAIREVYAPLWQVYAWDGPVDEPRWSAAWGAVTHADVTTTYPWHFEMDPRSTLGSDTLANSLR